MSRRIALHMVGWLLFTLAAGVVAFCAVRDVDLTAADGTKLKASYYPAPKSGPGVLLLHQCNRDRKIWDGLAQQLSGAGINVLTLDMRGFGESGGVPRTKAKPQEVADEEAQWPGDIDIALQYLESQPGVSKNTVGVGGASCGVNNSVQSAMRHPEVRSLVLLSGATNYAGRQFLRKSSNLPILFGYADDDEFPQSVITIQWLYDISPNPGKKMAHYTNGGHGADIFHAHPELMNVITDWYVTTLLKTPGQAPASQQVVSPSPTVQALNTLDQPGGATKLQTQLEEARRHDPSANLLPEDMVNVLGYDHLQGGDTKDAIEIFQLNVMAFPKSPNVYDSLSDAYLADGQKELAAQNAKKAVELLASDTTDNQQRKDAIKDSAEQKLKQLGDSAQ
jgi:dienelactone hydrolase